MPTRKQPPDFEQNILAKCNCVLCKGKTRKSVKSTHEGQEYATCPHGIIRPIKRMTAAGKKEIWEPL